MTTMAERLRTLHAYATTHRTFDLGLLLEAADELDRLVEQVNDADDWDRRQRGLDDTEPASPHPGRACDTTCDLTDEGHGYGGVFVLDPL